MLRSERSTSVGNRGSFHGSSDDGTCDDELHAIEANVAHLTDEPVVGNSQENIIERLYMLRSKLDLDRNRRITDHSDIDDGCWKQKLVETAHLGQVMGWDDPTTVRALNDYALLSINEVVCGKVTPLNVDEARQLPEWDEWVASMKAELKSLYDMGTFELVRRDNVPARSRISMQEDTGFCGF